MAEKAPVPTYRLCQKLRPFYLAFNKMTDSEYFDQLRLTIATWILSRTGFNWTINNENFPYLYGEEWEKGMEKSRKKSGKSREDFLIHLRIYMLFSN